MTDTEKAAVMTIPDTDRCASTVGRQISLRRRDGHQ
jgi:hypothetical protein